MTPRALLDRPTLTSRQNYLYGIYSEIARSRQLSQGGALPLDIRAIRDYTDYFRISCLDEREEIFDVAAALDDVYCEIVNKRKDEVDKPKSQ